MLQNLNAEAMADQIVSTVNKVVPMEKYVAQVYDGASVMKGHKKGVNARVRQIYDKVLHIHCRNHVLNLCLVGAVSSVQQADIFFFNPEIFISVFYIVCCPSKIYEGLRAVENAK
jgi:hypothetical protein